ncbi:hypothetical protein DV711_10565 [Motiliproteus coralliicola]|uniref:Uncharacterized protein n=1 Tax=Motiliproteus coralliicola TaxID=2283196 RepID=A0A369WLN0_9GAMM|nr:polysaccharide biosynthesis C-terminal domain-containing protein [Motiliproteus coralliicola]RDE22980.1 hypothetical protein DV711_10565 [Motiliproteus coralliicola]
MRTALSLALVSAIALALGKGTALIAKVILARTFSDADYGLFNVFLSLTSMLSIVAVIGLPKGVVGYYPRLATKTDAQALRGMVFYPPAAVVAASVIIAGTYQVLMQLGFAIDFQLQPKHWLIVAWTLPAQALILLFGHLLLASGRSTSYVVSSQLLFNGLFLVGVALLAWKEGQSLDALLNLYAFFSWVVVLLLAAWCLWVMKLDGWLDAWAAKLPPGEFWRYSFTLLLSMLCYVALGNVDRLMLIGWVRAGDVADYSVAFTVAATLPLMLLLVDAYLTPKLSSAFAAAAVEDAVGFYQRCNRLLALGASIVVVLFVVFAKPLLSLFDETYIRAESLLLILLLGEYINVLFGTSGRMLQLGGAQSREAQLVAVMVAFNVGLNFLLIPAYGVLGAVWATCLTRVLHALAKSWQIYLKWGATAWGEHWLWVSAVCCGTCTLLLVSTLA